MMPTDRDIDSDNWPRIHNLNTSMKLSDKCQDCKHSRASHLASVHAPLVEAVTDCNLVLYPATKKEPRGGKGRVKGIECDCKRYR